MKQVVLSGIEYCIKYSIRQFFIFEGLAGRKFEGVTLLGDYLLFYSNLIANNESFDLDFDTFISAVELDQSTLVSFSELMLQWVKINGQYKSEVEKKKS